jgi:hypothetical protein
MSPSGATLTVKESTALEHLLQVKHLLWYTSFFTVNFSASKTAPPHLGPML